MRARWGGLPAVLWAYNGQELPCLVVVSWLKCWSCTGIWKVQTSSEGQGILVQSPEASWGCPIKSPQLQRSHVQIWGEKFINRKITFLIRKNRTSQGKKNWSEKILQDKNLIYLESVWFKTSLFNPLTPVLVSCKSSVSLCRPIVRTFSPPFSGLKTAQCYCSVVHGASLVRLFCSSPLCQIVLFVPRDSVSTLLFPAHALGGWHCRLGHWLSSHSSPKHRTERRLQWGESGVRVCIPQQPPRQVTGQLHSSVKGYSALWVSPALAVLFRVLVTTPSLFSFRPRDV